MPTAIYQVFVDCFCASRPTPGLRRWHEPPEEPPEGRDHYGGDLDGLTSRLDHIAGLGVDAIYLTPIFAAPSNHKYDTADYDRVDPAFGDAQAFERLVAGVRERGMGLILDGVFNHVGETHPWTRERRELLTGSSWRGYPHVPEVDLRHPEVREAFFGDDGVIARWTRRGATGWRLDCANDLGLEICALATRAAKRAGARDGTIGELMSYPESFLGKHVRAGDGGRPLDGVMNYWVRQAVLGVAGGALSVDQAQEALDRLARDVPHDALIASWNVLSSHDTPRIATMLGGDSERLRLALVLAFTYPGVPLLYYGEEVGMHGGPDPANRAGMIWDEQRWDVGRLELIRALCQLRRAQPALRDGRYLPMPQPGTGLLAFARVTERPAETVVVVVNPGASAQRARVFLPLGTLFDAVPMHDLLSDARFSMEQGCLDVELGARGALVLQPRDAHGGGYRFYKST